MFESQAAGGKRVADTCKAFIERSAPLLVDQQTVLHLLDVVQRTLDVSEMRAFGSISHK